MFKSRWEAHRFWVRGVVALAMVACSTLTARTTAAQQRSLQSSLDLVPADVAFYWSSMNHAAIWNAVTGSEAYRQTQKTPLAVKLRNGYRRGRSRGWEIFGENPLRYYLEGWANSIDSPGGQLAMPYIKQVFGSEVFVYGDHRWLEWRQAFSAVYAELAPHALELKEGEQIDDQIVWPVVLKHCGQLTVPTFVAGAFVDEPEAFLGLLDLAASGMAQGLAQSPPEFQFLAEGFNVLRSEGTTVLTWTIRGDDLPWESLRETPDLQEFTPTLQQLCRGKTLGIAFGIRGKLLFVSFAENNDQQSKFGAGPLLVDEPQLQPVRKALADGSTLTGVNYLSAQLVAANRDFHGAFSLVPLAVQQMFREQKIPQVSPATQQELIAELRTFSEDLEEELSKSVARAGAYVSYSFLRPTGIEGYILDHSQPEFIPSTQPLAVLSHLGPAPALAVVDRNRGTQQQYNTWRPWIERLFRLAKDYGPEFAPNPDDAAHVVEALARIESLGVRLDQVLRELLLAQTDGKSIALAVDLSQRRTSWFREMPALDPEVPLPGLAVAIEFTDRTGIETFGKELSAFADEVVAMLRQANPEMPADFAVPKPDVASAGDATLYNYRLPADAGVPDELAPHARVMDRYLVLGYLLPQTEAMTAEHSPQFFGPAGQAEGAYAVAFLDAPQWVEAASAWLQYGIATAEAQGQSLETPSGAEDPLLEMSKAEIDQTLAAWKQFFECFRGYSARSDIVDGVQRTHYLWHFQDIPASAGK